MWSFVEDLRMHITAPSSLTDLSMAGGQCFGFGSVELAVFGDAGE